jgi:hypothetical protein
MHQASTNSSLTWAPKPLLFLQLRSLKSDTTVPALVLILTFKRGYQLTVESSVNQVRGIRMIRCLFPKKKLADPVHAASQAMPSSY